MKPKTLSGAKKRLKIKKSGIVVMRKSSKKHLLSDKSKRAKKSFMRGIIVTGTKLKIVKQLMPGKI